MKNKGRGVRRTEIPVDYVVVDPNGNRRSRRLAKKAKHIEPGWLSPETPRVRQPDHRG